MFNLFLYIVIVILFSPFTALLAIYTIVASFFSKETRAEIEKALDDLRQVKTTAVLASGITFIVMAAGWGYSLHGDTLECTKCGEDIEKIRCDGCGKDYSINSSKDLPWATPQSE